MKKIRVVIGILGMDQHEVGAVSVSRMLRDSGIEVIYIGMFNTPASIIKTSLEENVDVIGLSCHSWEYLYFIPELLKSLDQNNIKIPVIIGGSVVTATDGEKMKNMGVAACFGPSSTGEEIVNTVKRLA
jgi:methylmalonyl-CoA mutase C-terminal domain/subunit